jgi:predicted enzyme related to lactoylglutathione lyase
MRDPLEILRDTSRPIDPDPGFAAALRERLEQLLLAEPEEPTVTTTEKPTTTAPLTPYLAVPDAVAALEFYAAAFGATVRGTPITMPDGRIGHAEIVVGGALVMLADEFPDLGLAAPTPGSVSVTLHLDVGDPDALVDRAVAHGARLERPVADGPYGRGGVVVDPSGHRWMLTRPADGPGVRPGDLAYASLWTRDAAVADRFYRAVIGWDTAVDHDSSGRAVTSLSAPFGLFGADRSTLYCCWAVPDVDAAVAAVRAAGGTAEEPENRPYGRIADCTDDQGLRFSLTTATPAGAGRDTTGPGELAYLAIQLPDTTRARAFYGTALGWSFLPGREPGTWNVRGPGGDPRPAAGISPGPDPVVVPMFAVPDVRAAVARVREAGGTATDPAFAGYGTSADCTDDQGAPFWLTEF